MAFTDPPYDIVAYGDHGGRRPGSRRRRIANDSLDPVAWETFVRAWAQTFALFGRRSHLHLHELPRSYHSSRGCLPKKAATGSDTLIWAKDRFVLGRADYQRAYEPIWYGWREGTGHYLVWRVVTRPTSGRSGSPAEAPLHPTMKPLPIMERAISNRAAEQAT